MSNWKTVKLNVRVGVFYAFRVALFVSVVTLTIALLFIFLPQASELILAQSTANGDTEVFASQTLRAFWHVVTSALSALALALSIWYCARVMTDQAAHINPATLLATDDEAEMANAVQGARTYVPRLLGLIVFMSLQIAAAKSGSEHGYLIPVACAASWLSITLVIMLHLSAPSMGKLVTWTTIAFCSAAGAFTLCAYWHDHSWLMERQNGNEAFVKEQLAAIEHAALCLAVFNLSLIVWAGVRLLSVSPRIEQVSKFITWAVAAAAVVALIVVGVFVEGTVSESPWQFFLFIALQSAAGALYWWFVRRRRQYLGDSTKDKTGFWWQARWWLGLSLFALVSFVAWASCFPEGMGKVVGSVATVLLFVALGLVVIIAAQKALNRLWPQLIPVSGIAIALVTTSLILNTPPENTITDPVPDRSPISTQTAAQIPAEPYPKEGPLFVVLAHGGGIRAAQYTAVFMSYADQMSQGDFSRRLVVASGASGGSIGLATWAAIKRAGCMDSTNADLRCVRASLEVLQKDHLSSVLAAFLFHDLFVHFSPWDGGPIRGKALGDSVLSASRTADTRFTLPISAEMLRDIRESNVRLILNTAEVATAKPVSFVSGREIADALKARGVRVPEVKISLLRASVHSSRFPVVSPKGLVDSDGPVVVDGGFFDNSGLTTLRYYLETLPENDLKRIVYISLDNTPIGDAEPKTDPTRATAFATSYISTVLGARGAHGLLNWKSICDKKESERFLSARIGVPTFLSGCDWPTETTVMQGRALWAQQTIAFEPALGWFLSARSARRVHDDAGMRAAEISKFLASRK